MLSPNYWSYFLLCNIWLNNLHSSFLIGWKFWSLNNRNAPSDHYLAWVMSFNWPKTMALNRAILIYRPVIDNQLIELYLLCHRELLYKVLVAPVWGYCITLTLPFLCQSHDRARAGTIFKVFGMTRSDHTN